MNETLVYCKCGCGELVKPGLTTKRKPREFINGHQMRGMLNGRYIAEKHVRQLCGCACGLFASAGKKFIRGHSSKGVKNPMHGRRMSGGRHWHFTPALHILHPCLCGCGSIVKGRTKYVHGHSNKGEGNPNYKKELHEPKYCGCGCGGNVNFRRRFIKGHHTRGSLNTRWGKGALPNTGFGCGCFFIYEGKKLWLRSTYELVVAIYFVMNGLEINYEDKYVEYCGHTYLSDFRIDNTIFEVKGYMTSKALLAREAFTSSGYSFEIIGEQEVKTIKRHIAESGYDINRLVRKIYGLKHKGGLTFDSSYLQDGLFDKAWNVKDFEEGKVA